MITQQYLKEILYYDPTTGEWTWLRSKNRAREGEKAGALSGKYIKIGIDKAQYLAHRLVFLYMTGTMPHEADHIDGNKTNNAWSNLRVATRPQNVANNGKRPDNQSGYKGVTWHQNAWRVTCRGNHLGYFGHIEDAALAYKFAAYFEFGDYYRECQ